MIYERLKLNNSIHGNAKSELRFVPILGYQDPRVPFHKPSIKQHHQEELPHLCVSLLQ